MAEKSGTMTVDTALVRQLAELLDETKLTEIEVEDGDRKIRVARTAAVAAAAPVSIAAPAAAVAPAAPASSTSRPSGHANAMKSPMVGTVYLAAEPGSRPFANVGDSVTEGQTILIIEAMKVMNPIAADRAGRIAAILVENGAPVEYDQPLVVIE
jgi:acetyl-CoA carboxylase biotin carboxyl carrier protein